MNKGYVESLTLEQKIEFILSGNVLELIIDNDYNINSLFKLNELSLYEESNNFLNSVINSWNLNLVQLMVEKKVEELHSVNANILSISLFDLKNNNNFFRTNNLEEAYLTRSFLHKYISINKKQGVYVIGKLVFDAENKEANSKQINEILNFIKESKMEGVIIYGDSSFARLLKKDYNYDGLILLAANDENNLPVYSIYSEINNNYETKSDLEEAIFLYEGYNAGLEDGSIDETTFNDALDQGEIVSETKIDDEIFKVLEFVDNIYFHKEIKDEASSEEINLVDANGETSNEEAIISSKEEMFVLLKNQDKTLPIPAHLTVGFIGDFDLFDKMQDKIEKTITEYFPNYFGYFIETNNITEATDEMFNNLLIELKDSAVVVLKVNAKDEKFKLNQFQNDFVDKLNQAGKKVVFLLPQSSKYIDAKVVENSAAIIKGQITDFQTMKAFLNILAGEASPSGKITYPIYLLNNDQEYILYPFGFGLSYAKFTYSNLELVKNGVEFTLKNASGIDGCTIPQLYAYDDYLLKKKQLIAFDKVFLKPGEIKTVRLEYDPQIFEIESKENNQLENNKAGNITFELSSSKNQVELSLKTDQERMKKLEIKLEKTDKAKTKTQEIKLEKTAAKSAKQSSVSSKIKQFNWKAIFAILVLVLINILFIIVLDNAKEREYYATLLIFIIVVDIFSLYLIWDFSRGSEKNTERTVDSLLHLMDGIEYLVPVNEEIYIEEPVIISTAEVDENFQSEESLMIEKPKKIISSQVIYDEVKMENYIELLYDYMSDNGLRISKSNAREIFSCMAASNLIIVNSSNREISKYFIQVFNNYIGANSFYEKAQSQWKTFSDLFQEDNQLGKCIQSANNKSDLIHFMTVENVDLTSVDNYFGKVIEFAKNPLMPAYLDEVKDLNVVKLPENIWYMIIPFDAENKAASSELLQAAVTINLDAKLVTPKETVMANGLKISYHYFMDSLRDAFEQHYINEELWKKVDQLEQYVNERTPFSIGNRVFRQLERYTTMYLLCGGEEYEALDCVLAAKLLTIIAKLPIEKKEDEEEGLFTLAEKLFGLDNLIKSKTIFKLIDDAYNLKNK